MNKTRIFATLSVAGAFLIGALILNDLSAQTLAKGTPDNAGILLAKTKGRPNLVGVEKAKGILQVLEESYPKENFSLEQVAMGVIGGNLSEVLERVLSDPAKRCQAARSILAEGEFTDDLESSCGDEISNIADNAPCSTVEGLLAYYTDTSESDTDADDDRPGKRGKKKIKCKFTKIYKDKGAFHIGQCGCGCECCSVVY